MRTKPVFSAKKIDDGKYVCGDYISELDLIVPRGEYLTGDYRVDPSTLVMSFDEEHWCSVGKIKTMVAKAAGIEATP